MAAALELFAEKGFSASRLEDVAERAGVSKGTVYLYFNDKEDLFRKVVKADIIENIDVFEKMIESHQGDIAPLLKSILEQIGKMIAETRLGAIPKIILSEAGNFPALASFYRENVVKRMFRLFTALIERGVHTGEFRGISPPDAARIMMAPFLMMALMTNSPGFAEAVELQPAKHVETALDIFFTGILAENTGERI